MNTETEGSSVLIYNHLDSFGYSRSKEEVLDKLVASVEDSPVGFAGFLKKDYLKNTLSWLVFDSGQAVNGLDLSIPVSDEFDTVKQAVGSTLEKCTSLLEVENNLYVHIFPTWSSFVREDMDSISGFTPYKNTLLLFIEGGAIQEEALAQTIAHEYLHTQHYNYQELKTLRDALVFEGLAELFSEAVTGKRSKFSESLNEEEIDDLCKILYPHFDVADLDLQRKVFTHGDKYPLWGGYALGYKLVSEYKKNNPNIHWLGLLMLDSKQIIK